MIHEKTIVEYSKEDFSDIIIDMWNKIEVRLKG